MLKYFFTTIRIHSWILTEKDKFAGKLLFLILENYSLPNKTDKEILINGKGDTTKNPKKSSIKKNQKYKPIKLVWEIIF